MKKKRTYDITHKVIRVRISAYAFFVELGRKAGLPMAEALHLFIAEHMVKWLLENKELERTGGVAAVSDRGR